MLGVYEDDIFFSEKLINIIIFLMPRITTWWRGTSSCRKDGETIGRLTTRILTDGEQVVRSTKSCHNGQLVGVISYCMIMQIKRLMIMHHSRTSVLFNRLRQTVKLRIPLL